MHVTGRRPDGYHLLESLVVFAEFGDRLRFEAADADTLSVTGPYAEGVPTDGRNLVVAARERLRGAAAERDEVPPSSGLRFARPPSPPGGEEVSNGSARFSSKELARRLQTSSPLGGEGGRAKRRPDEGEDCQRGAFPTPVAIDLEKNLPVASGIGGGSSDAAAALRGLDHFWDLHLSPAELAAIGKTLGADVPMCLLAKPLIARGIGDIVEPLGSFPSLPVVLVNPAVPVATPAVFATLASRDNPPLPAMPKFPDLSALLAWLAETRNDLEEPARNLAPPITEALAALRGSGAAFARMSGSGATCFGLFASQSEAWQAAAGIRRARPGWFAIPTLAG